MIREELRSKRYELPVIDLNNRNSSHTITVELTGYNKTVLEIGTSTGYVSKILRERGNKVVGIEMDPEAASIARNYCDQIIVGDIETLELENIFEQGSFDVVIFGDVLEHLRWPNIVLEKIKRYLRLDGYIVVSLPNIAHGDIILNLLSGKFKYTEIGLLDVTHFRFFALEDIIQLFDESGYQVDDLQTTTVEVGNTEVHVNLSLVPEEVLEFVKSLPYSNIYQFVFKAYLKKSGSIRAISLPTIDLMNVFNKFKDVRIGNLEAAIRDKDARIMSLETYIYDIESSLSWRIIIKLRRIKEKLFPLRTKRRQLFDLFIKSIKVINNEGFSSFYVKVKKRLRQQKPIQYKVTGGALNLNRKYANDPLDIILPVYNGYYYVVSCIEAILKYTDLNFHRLLIIDDKSPDPRIGEFLDKLSKKNLNIEVLHNDENLGFVKTVNKGMKFSNKDVILLNSDTQVTAKWVEKLQRAAYSKPRVASVTPFSNNATLCSIPKFFENNKVPDGFTVDSFAEFIEHISLSYYPEIPSSVGFCNFIKREVLEKVGYFDEEHFKKGYGEECEFCARTLLKGYIHILDDSTYIYHKGGVSFALDVKMKKEKEHLEVLDRLYPWYLPMAHKFFKENPLKPLHDYINLRIYNKVYECFDREL